MPNLHDATAQIGSTSWLAQARVLKDSGRTSVFEGELDGRAVIVKTMRLRPWRDLPARLFGRTRLMRQLRGARLLEEAEIATAAPLLLVRGKRSDQPGTFEALVLKKLEGRTLLRVIADGGLSVREEHALAHATGILTMRFAMPRVKNRDHKPSNIIVRQRTDGSFALSVVDTVGVTKGVPHLNKMMANLCYELIGTGLLPRQSMLMRTLLGFQFGLHLEAVPRRKQHNSLCCTWRRIERLIDAHGDCTPKDDPLASD